MISNAFIGYSRAAHFGEVLCGAYHGGLWDGALCALSGCQCCLRPHAESFQLWMGKCPVTSLYKPTFLWIGLLNSNYPLFTLLSIDPNVGVLHGLHWGQPDPCNATHCQECGQSQWRTLEAPGEWGLDNVCSNISKQLVSLQWNEGSRLFFC